MNKMDSFHIMYPAYYVSGLTYLSTQEQTGHHHYVARNRNIMLYLSSTSYIVVICAVQSGYSASLNMQGSNLNNEILMILL